MDYSVSISCSLRDLLTWVVAFVFIALFVLYLVDCFVSILRRHRILFSSVVLLSYLALFRSVFSRIVALVSCVLLKSFLVGSLHEHIAHA